MQARLAELDADALHLADAEALADEVVQPHAADDDLPAGLGAGEADVLEHLGLDQRQRAARARSRLGHAVADEAVPGDGLHRLDGRERLRRPDHDRLDAHAPKATRSRS